MAPLVLGIVLGDLMEKSLRRGLVLSDGDLTPFFTRPISAVLFVTIVLIVAFRFEFVRRLARRLGRARSRRAFVMRLALCNEVLRDRDFAAQCAYAAALGYDALEVAPFTLGDDPLALPPSRAREVRRAASDAGIAISGLHWLLVKPEGLSVTSPDPAVRARTIESMRSLVALCAELGGRYLVHGSPAQRRTPVGVDAARRARGSRKPSPRPRRRRERQASSICSSRCRVMRPTR